MGSGNSQEKVLNHVCAVILCRFQVAGERGQQRALPVRHPEARHWANSRIHRSRHFVLLHQGMLQP